MVCVKFTPRQYIKLYECGLLYVDNTALNTTGALLQSLWKAAQQWLVNDEFNFHKVLTVPRNTPNHSSCKLAS